MDNQAYQIRLLEHIAYKLSPGNREFAEWQTAFRISVTAEEMTNGTAPTPEVSKQAAKPKPPESEWDAIREGIIAGAVKQNRGDLKSKK